jgi:hypothetical protein
MDYRSVNNRVVPNGYKVAHDALAANVGVNCAVILDAAMPSNSNSAHVSAQHSVLPDAAAFPDFDIPYQGRTWRDIGAGADLWLLPTELG